MLLLHLMAKSWLACKLLVSYMPLAWSVGRAHDASSKGKNGPLSSKDTTASSHPALEIIAFAAASHWRLKVALFHRYSQTDSIRDTNNTLTVVASAENEPSARDRAGEQRAAHKLQCSASLGTPATLQPARQPQRWQPHWCS